jgi:hypothetical protein
MEVNEIMARYCFYCGRELSAGEKCNCRTNGAASGQTAASANHQADARASAGSRKHCSAFRRFIQFFNPFSPESDVQSARQKPAAKAAKNRPAYKSGQAGRAGAAGLSWQSLKPSLVQIGRYVIRPADSLSQAAFGSVRQPVVLVLVLQGIGGGLLLLSATRQTFLQSLLSINIAPLWENSGFFNVLSIFAQGFSFTLAGSLVLTLLYFLALRFLYRQPTGFQQLLSGLCPSFFYTTLFLFAALLILRTSLFNAAMLLLVSFAVSALAHFLAMRQILAQDDNRSLSLVIFVLILYSGILAAILNLTLPLFRAFLDQSAVV